MIKLCIIAALIFYGVCNLVMAYKLDAAGMYNELIVGQCTVGMISANLFYAPAWVLKVLREIILALVR